MEFADDCTGSQRRYSLRIEQVAFAPFTIAHHEAFRPQEGSQFLDSALTSLLDAARDFIESRSLSANAPAGSLSLESHDLRTGHHPSEAYGIIALTRSDVNYL